MLAIGSEENPCNWIMGCVTTPATGLVMTNCGGVRSNLHFVHRQACGETSVAPRRPIQSSCQPSTSPGDTVRLDEVYGCQVAPAKFVLSKSNAICLGAPDAIAS